MYNEKSYRRLLFMIKVKRVFFIVLIALGGSILGGFISSYLVDVLMFSNLSKNHIVIIFAVAFFIIGEIITTGMERTVHDGYWRIATLRKLTLVSKKLDSLERIEKILSNIDNADDIARGETEDYDDNYSIFDKDVQKRLKEINHPTKYHYVGNENYSFFDRDAQNKLKEDNYSLFDKDAQADNKTPENNDFEILTSDTDFANNVENITSTLHDISNKYLEELANDQQESSSAPIVEVTQSDTNPELDTPEVEVEYEKPAEHRYKRKNKKERIRNKRLNRKKKEISK